MQQEAIINFRIVQEGATRSLSNLRKELSGVEKQIRKIESGDSKLRGIAKTNRLITLNERLPELYREIAIAQENVRKSTTRLNKAIGNKPFAGYALSIMFAGMAVQRTFMSIWKLGSKSFQEISNSIEGSTNKFNELDSSMKFLGFTVGQALEPLVENLILIVDKVSDWIDENPELTKGIIAFGLALGSLMLVGGGLQLAIDGITNFFNLTRASNFAGQGAAIAKAFGAISIVYGITKISEGLNAIAEGEVTKGISKALGGAFTSYGGMRLLMGKGGALPWFVIGVGLELLSENRFFQTIGRFTDWLLALFQTVFQKIGHDFRNSFIGGMQSIIESLQTIFGGDLLFKIFGIDIKQIQRNLLGINKSDFDWAGNYSKNLAGLSDSRKIMDQYLQYTVMEPIRGAEYVDSFNDKPVFYINIDTINSQGLNLDEVLSEVEKANGIIRNFR